MVEVVEKEDNQDRHNMNQGHAPIRGKGQDVLMIRPQA